MRACWTDPYPAGESWLQAADRVGWFLRDLGQYGLGHRVLFVGHIASYWGLVHHLDGVPMADLIARGFDWQLGWEFALADAIGG